MALKASQAILSLQALVKDYGDLNVVIESKDKSGAPIYLEPDEDGFGMAVGNVFALTPLADEE